MTKKWKEFWIITLKASWLILIIIGLIIFIIII